MSSAADLFPCHWKTLFAWEPSCKFRRPGARSRTQLMSKGQYIEYLIAL